MNFLSKLAVRQPQLGLCIMYPSAGVVERIGGDWDWIWIDGQHGQIGYNESLALVRATDLVGRASLVRVSGHDFGGIGMALDTGATGVIVPVVDTPEQAQRAVDAAKFPPLGKRSYGGRRPIDLQGRTYAETANTDRLLIVQIESPEAVANVDAIAATPGVDGLFLGPDDIALRRGYAMTRPRDMEMLGADMRAVIEACHKHGKFGVMVAASDELFRASVTMGFSLIVVGGDVPFLANSSRTAADWAQGLLQEMGASQPQSVADSGPEPGEASNLKSIY